MIIATLLTTLSTGYISDPSAFCQYKATWRAIYEADEELSHKLIGERSCQVYEDQAMKLFMNAYLIYRIEMKTGKENPEAKKKAFENIDEFVEEMMWAD